MPEMAQVPSIQVQVRVQVLWICTRVQLEYKYKYQVLHLWWMQKNLQTPAPWSGSPAKV